MKLTKQTLYELITEEMKYYRPARFDPRAKKEFPEYADKLTNLAGTGEEGFTQAMEFSDALDNEPIDIGTEDQELHDWEKYYTRMGKSKEQKQLERAPWQAAKKKFKAWAENHPLYKGGIWKISKLKRSDALQEFLSATGDQGTYDVMKRTLDKIHMSIHLNNRGANWER